MSKLRDFFYKNKKVFRSQKIDFYFDIYNRHFAKFIGRNPKLLEIGVDYGGSLEMWNHYFDGDCGIYGLDRSGKTRSKKIEKYHPNVTVNLGDQGSIEMWDEYKKTAPKFDIIIDDGGHTMDQQITTFECMYDHMTDDGVYLTEDVHTSYWGSHGGGLKTEGTFIEYAKGLTDKINAAHWDVNYRGKVELIADTPELDFTKKTRGIHFYDSVVVLERGRTDDIKKKLTPVDATNENGEVPPRYP